MDLAYIAGFIDADGSIGVRSRLGAKPDLTISITQRVEYRRVVDEAVSKFGGWLHISAGKYICWSVRANKAKKCLNQLVPHLVSKQDHARRLLDLVNESEILRSPDDLAKVRQAVKDIRSVDNPHRNSEICWRWLAGYFDGDGSFSTSISKDGYGYPSASILAAANYKSGLNLILGECGGNMCSIGPHYQWSLPISIKSNCRHFLASIVPFLVIKKPQAEFLLGCISRGGFLDGASVRKSLMALNGRASGAQVTQEAIRNMLEQVDFSIEKRWLFKTDFIAHANLVHDGKYDYSKSIYVSTKTKLSIICPEHGEFSAIPNDHLNGRGCPACAKRSYKAKRQLSFHEFSVRANAAHDDKYDYTSCGYNINRSAVIKCRLHGEFTQQIFNHLNGAGCPACAYLLSFKDDFINDATLKHGGFYDYSKTQYVNTRSKVTITCPFHGDFQQTPFSHLQGYGCLQCAKLRPRPESKKKTDLNGYAERAKQVHGDSYTYDSLVRVGRKINITCPLHGMFMQDMFNHLNGSKCPKCSRNHPKMITIK